VLLTYAYVTLVSSFRYFHHTAYLLYRQPNVKALFSPKLDERAAQDMDQVTRPLPTYKRREKVWPPNHGTCPIRSKSTASGTGGH